MNTFYSHPVISLDRDSRILSLTLYSCAETKRQDNFDINRFKMEHTCIG